MAIVISSNEVLDPSKSSIGFGIHFFQTFVDVEKTVETTAKDLEYYKNLVDKAVAGFERTE